MDIRKLQRAIVDGLEDVKAVNIAVFNTEHLSSMFERVIIASGSSNRQTKALASSVRESVKARGMQVMSTEGEDNGEWIIVDCGAAVAHIMQPAIREYYHLEEIWGGKAVKLKLGEAKTGLVKASEPEPVGKPARKAGTKTSTKAGTQAGLGEKAKTALKAAGKPAAKAAPKSAAPAGAKPAARPTAARKAVAGKTPARKAGAVTKTMVVGLPTARKTARKTAGKTAAPRTAAKKPAARKTGR
jgi:ribosome-associated protein